MKSFDKEKAPKKFGACLVLFCYSTTAMMSLIFSMR